MGLQVGIEGWGGGDRITRRDIGMGLKRDREMGRWRWA